MINLVMWRSNLASSVLFGIKKTLSLQNKRLCKTNTVIIFPLEASRAFLYFLTMACPRPFYLALFCRKQYNFYFVNGFNPGVSVSSLLSVIVWVSVVLTFQ